MAPSDERSADELHRRNQELARVNSDLVNVLGTVDIPIVILDMERRIRRFTPSATRILDVLPSDLGRPLRDVRLHIDVGDLDEQITTVLATRAVKESEVQDQAGHWYRLQIRPYLTLDDRIDGVTLSFVDIDALKHLVGAAQEARGEAERANVAKDQFLALLSHELRSPLASILVHAQMLGRGGLDDGRVRRAGEAIERGTKMQVRLIDDLLDVSRIVAGKLQLDPRTVDLARVVNEALEAARAPAARQGIEIVKVVAAEAMKVHGDPTRLSQIVTNLLVNAIKFTPEGGRVTLTLEQVGGSARLVVSDTGIGIEPGFLPRVFNRFAQEDSSSTRGHGGLGLGLAIVRHLVELHGGTVRAESAGKGQGASLSVTLPLMGGAENDVPRAARLQPADDNGLVDLRVLLVDDDALTRDAIAEILRQRGARVALAGSADEAMTAIAAVPPEVLVCDIAMPGEDGYGFLRRLRALGGDAPALALTALAGDDDRRRALDAGFQLHLAKPVDIDRLVEAVAALRPRRPGS